MFIEEKYWAYRYFSSLLWNEIILANIIESKALIYDHNDEVEQLISKRTTHFTEYNFISKSTIIS